LWYSRVRPGNEQDAAAFARATLPCHGPKQMWKFMQGMIMHHSQAVEMTALIASRTENESCARWAQGSVVPSRTNKVDEAVAGGQGRSSSMATPGKANMDMSHEKMALMPGMLTPERWRRCGRRRARSSIKSIFERHDSAPRWRDDHGEGFVRYAGRGAGCRGIQLRDGMWTIRNGRDQDMQVFWRKNHPRETHFFGAGVGLRLALACSRMTPARCCASETALAVIVSPR